MSIKCCIIPFYDIYLKLQSTDFSKVYGFFITEIVISFMYNKNINNVEVMKYLMMIFLASVYFHVNNRNMYDQLI